MTDTRADYRIARTVAVVAGVLGTLLAILTPLLPVKQTTAELNWPQNGVMASVQAPLIGYVATDLDISVPCQAAAGLTPAKSVLLSTVPKQAPKAVDRGLLIELVNDDLVLVVRNVPVVVAPLAQVLGPDCQKLTFTAHADRVTAEFVGLTYGPNAEKPGSPLTGTRSGYDFRPQIVGVYTDLAGPAPAGLDFSATIDTRFSSAPTPLKLAAMILGVMLTAAAIGASNGASPNCLERRCKMVRSGPIATSRAPIEAIPVGPENSVIAPMMQAIANGSRRLVATARSTEHQVARMPSAMIGSGRRPLFSGSQNARNMPAAVQAAARLCLTALPRRGITSRLISHQLASAMPRVGSRIQMLVVDTCDHTASRS